MLTRSKSTRPRPKADAENPYWVSFSDIMAGLLVIFILALVTLMIQQQVEAQRLEEAAKEEKAARARALTAESRAVEAEARAKAAEIKAQKNAVALAAETEKNRDLRQEIVEGVVRLSEIEKIRIEMLDEIRAKLNDRGIIVEVSDNNSVLRIPEDTLAFETAKWDVPDLSKNSLSTIGAIVHDAITKDDRLTFIDTIFVEGHTDSVPLQRDMGNWGLSTYRAISVWDFWKSDPGASNQLYTLKNHEDRPAFSVSGYGETRRVIPNDILEKDRRQNRRIDLRFTMKSVDKADLSDLLKRFQ